MKILLTGASGFLGQHVYRLMVQNADLDITVLSRSCKVPFPKICIVEDLNEGCDLSDALKSQEVVVHCAARVHVMEEKGLDALEAYRSVNTLGTLNLARQAAKYGVKRFIFISSIKVNGESTDLSTPFSAGDERCPKDAYGISKSEAESGLLEISQQTGMEVVILRPPLVYGPGVKANFSALLSLVKKGVPLPFASLSSNKRSLVSVTNLADLIFTCLSHPKAGNQVFLVSDDHDISTSEMVKFIALSLGVKDRQFPFPVSGYELLGQLLGKTHVVERLVGSLQIDITHTKNTLGWTPPISLEEGFKETAIEFLNPKDKIVNHD